MSTKDKSFWRATVHCLKQVLLAKLKSVSNSFLFQISDLQLTPFLIPVTNKKEATRLRLIFSNEHNMVAAPGKWSQLLRSGPLFSRPLLMTILKEAFTKQNTEKEDESVHDFTTRRFSSEVHSLFGSMHSLCYRNPGTFWYHLITSIFRWNSENKNTVLTGNQIITTTKFLQQQNLHAIACGSSLWVSQRSSRWFYLLPMHKITLNTHPLSLTLALR